MGVDGLPNPNDTDLSWLKAGGRGAGIRIAGKLLVCVAASAVAIILAVVILNRMSGDEHDAGFVIQQLLELQEPWSVKLAEDIDDYRGWLSRHGTNLEAQVFQDLSSLVAQSALSTSSSPSESFFSALFVSAHAGCIRAIFLLIASLRLWLAATIVAFFMGVRTFRPYQADDLLGQTGNGRLFYSGARAGLDHLAQSGAPDVLVRGLACPDYVSSQQAHSSAIWQTLKACGATNATNEALTAIIEKHGDTAPFVPRLEDELRYHEAFQGSTLSEHVPHILRATLETHAALARDTNDYSNTAPAEFSLVKASSESYSSALAKALVQVMSPRLREELARIPPEEIATLVLALESAKVLAHSMEGGKWFRRSNFPHLSARAVLHSVVAYPHEYDFDSRQRLRQALVYALRTSSFAPVRMPLGMSDDVWALRQWAEILLAPPHELAETVEDVELVGITRAAHQRWSEDIAPQALSLIPELSAVSYTTHADLFFVPLWALVKLLRSTIESRDLQRLAHLSAIVGERQRIKIEKMQQSEEGGAGALIYDKVFPPIPSAEIEGLVKLHNLEARDLQDWSALRNILASFGWLARRVGDYTVSESSVIFSVFKATFGHPGANALGLFGVAGLVPLRGSKFKEVCGPAWDRELQSFQSATMSESQENFQRLMQGHKDELEEEEGAAAPPVGA